MRDDASDDGVSVAGSGSVAGSVAGSIKTRKRKSEAERIAWFHEDELCDELEAHRVLCKGCKKWIDLHPKLRYVMKSWVVHRRTCT